MRKSSHSIRTALRRLYSKKRILGTVYEELLFDRAKDENDVILLRFLNKEINKLNEAIDEIRSLT